MVRFGCLLLLTAAACQSSRSNYGQKAVSHAGKAGESLKVQVVWIKHRGDTVHVFLDLLNQASGETLLDSDWLELSTDGLRGHPTKKLPTWAMRPGEPHKKAFIFKFERKVARANVELWIHSRTGGTDNPVVAFNLPQ